MTRTSKRVGLRLRRLCLITAMSIAALAVAVPMAGALPTLETDVALPRALPYTYNCVGDDPVTNGYGVACFHRDGDDLRIADGASDSRSVGIYWQVATNSNFTTVYRRGICLDRDGASDNWHHCTKNFAEGDWLRIKVGRCNGSSENCWDLDSYTDWSGWRVYHNVN